MLALKVTSAFADYGVGDTITDKSEMREVQASNPASVVRVRLSDEEADAVKAERAAGADIVAKEALKPPAPTVRSEAAKADDKTA